MLKIERLIAEASELPFYVGLDNASDAPDHTNSGLALIETGRVSDFTVARLMEWNNAKLFCALGNSAPELVALVKAAQRVREEMGDADYKQHVTDKQIAICEALATLQQRPEWREE